MKVSLIMIALLLASATAEAEGRTSTNYAIAAESISISGSRATSGNYTLDGSVGGIVGFSSVSSPTTRTAKLGYIGQLYEVTGLTLTSASSELSETDTLQLNAAQTLDDASFLEVPATSVAWGVISGPLTSINSNGLAASGNVYVDTSAVAQGDFAGFTGTLALTVKNVTFDDFGSYATDGIDDAWQVNFLGLDNTVANPDADLQANLGEFFLNLNPVLPDGFDAVVPGFIEIDDMNYQTLGFRRSLAATAFVRVEVLRSTDLLLDWSNEKTTEVSATPIDAETEWVVVRSTVPTDGLTEEYLKLSVTATVDATILFQSLPFGFRLQPTKALADTLFGIPLHPSTAWAGEVSAVSGNVFNIAAGALPENYGGSSHEVIFTSHALQGRRYRIASNTATTVTLDPQSPDALAVQGLQVGDSFKIVPFWTLSSLFASQEDIAVTGQDVLNPVTTVKLYDPSDTGINIAPRKTYFFHDGSLLPEGAGWYDNDDIEAGRKDNVVLLPENFLVVRNSTAAALPLRVVGQVPVDPLGATLGRPVEGVQDSLATNPYPVAVSLGALGLVTSSIVDITGADVLNPVDTVKFRVQPMGFNPAPNKTYFYHDGSLLTAGIGWYDNDGLEEGLQNDVLVPPGGSIIVRKGFGPSSMGTWLPPLPYSP